MGGSALLLAARELREKLDAGERPPLEAHARFESDYVFSSGAYAAVVEIDPETGALRVKRIAAVDDAGTIINHELADGQVLGGSVHGLGASLLEEFVHDEDGQPLQRQLHRLRDAVRGRGAGDPHRVHRVALPAQPARRQGHRRGRHDRRPGRARQRGRGRNRGDPRGSPYTPEKLWRASSSR